MHTSFLLEFETSPVGQQIKPELISGVARLDIQGFPVCFIPIGAGLDCSPWESLSHGSPGSWMRARQGFVYLLAAEASLAGEPSQRVFRQFSPRLGPNWIWCKPKKGICWFFDSTEHYPRGYTLNLNVPCAVWKGHFGQFTQELRICGAKYCPFSPMIMTHILQVPRTSIFLRKSETSHSWRVF